MYVYSSEAFCGPYIVSSHFDKYIHTRMNMFSVSKALIHETNIINRLLHFLSTVLNVKVTYSRFIVVMQNHVFGYGTLFYLGAYTHIDLVLFKTKIREQVNYHFIQNIYIYIYIYIIILDLLKHKIKAFQMIQTFTVIL